MAGARAGWLRTAVIVAGSGVLAWLSISVGLSAATRDRDPGLALRLAPWDARAKANLAKVEIQGGTDAGQRARAVALAQSAVARDATLVTPHNILGLAAALSGRTNQAAAYFSFADRLTKRDMVTQLWLIEYAVARDDIEGALSHFDAALRTAWTAQDVLFPILVEATGDPQLVAPIGRILEKQPQWAPNFLWRATEGGPSAANVAQLLLQLRKAGYPLTTENVRLMLQRAVRDNRLDVASVIFDAFSGARQTELVRNGGFAGDNKYPPFDWDLTDDVELRAERAPKADSEDIGVNVFADAGRGGTAARQLLRLSPGSYRLRTAAGDISMAAAERPNWTIACAGRSNSVLLTMPLANGTGAGASFSVPADCGTQWLSLIVKPVDQADGAAFWIDDVKVDRLAPAGS